MLIGRPSASELEPAEADGGDVAAAQLWVEQNHAPVSPRMCRREADGQSCNTWRT